MEVLRVMYRSHHSHYKKIIPLRRSLSKAKISKVFRAAILRRMSQNTARIESSPPCACGFPGVYDARQTEERPRAAVRRKGMLSDVEPCAGVARLGGFRGRVRKSYTI